MDPYAYDDVELEAAAPTVAAQARSQRLRGARPLASMPTSGVESLPPQPTHPLTTPDYRGKAVESLQQASDQDSTEADRRALIDYQRQRHAAAGPDMMLGMMMAERGGKTGREFGGQILRNALAAREPLKVEGGFATPEQFVVDPEHAARQRATRLETQSRIYATMASNADTVEQRRVAAEAANEVRREALELRRTLGANRQEPLVPVYDPQTQQTTYQPRSAAAGQPVPPRAGAGGRQLPSSAVDKISEDEGKVAQFSNLVGTWKPEFGGIGTGVGNVIGNYSPVSSEAQRSQAQWWRGYQAFVNEMRHGQFGAALTPTEKAEFEKAIVTNNTDPRIVSDFLDRQMSLAEKARGRRVSNLGRAGYDVSGFGGGAGGAVDFNSLKR